MMSSLLDRLLWTGGSAHTRPPEAIGNGPGQTGSRVGESNPDLRITR